MTLPVLRWAVWCPAAIMYRHPHDAPGCGPGLGSIWVMYWDPERMKQEFSLDEDLAPAALLIVGHKAAEAYPKKGHMVS